jgi:hypothetical protein
MTVLRMGFPGLENALRAVFHFMREEEIRRFPFAFASNSVIVPRASGSISYIKNIAFEGVLPIKEKKIITVDDLIEFEQVKLKPYFIVKVYLSTGNSLVAYSYVSFPRSDRAVGYIHEGELTTHCKRYNSVTKALPLNISNEEDEKLADMKFEIFKVVSTMIPAANLLYSLYNLDKGVRFFILDYLYTSEDEKKIRSVAERVKKVGDTFPEAVVNLGFMYNFM